MEKSRPEPLSPLSPGKLKRRDVKTEDKPPTSYLEELARLLLPPFLITAVLFLWRVLVSLVSFIIGVFKPNRSMGESSQEFHKRRYEEEIEDLDIDQEQLGFTNQVLVQDSRKTVNFFLPVYITCKIKSIQDVSVQSLTGNISCAMIINVRYDDLPEEIIDKL